MKQEVSNKNVVSDNNLAEPIVACITKTSERLTVWGLTPIERLHRVLPGFGVQEITEHINNLPQTGKVLLLRGDVVYESPILLGILQNYQTLVTQDNIPVAAFVAAKNIQAARAWLIEGGQAPKNISIHLATDVAGKYQFKLRKSEPAFCGEIKHDNLNKVEKRLFMGAYKGVTDLVTKYVWPWPATHVTRWCTKCGI